MLTRADLRFLVLAYAWVALLLCAVGVGGQSVTIGAGEIRHSEHGRQDFAGIEVGHRIGHVQTYAHAAIRHGDQDFRNTRRPWINALAGYRAGPVGGYAGLQVVPYSYGDPVMVFGPRLDLPLGSRASLTVSHLWREHGLVRNRATHWTPETAFGLSWRVV
jgi:hypothetical protein